MRGDPGRNASGAGIFPHDTPHGLLRQPPPAAVVEEGAVKGGLGSVLITAQQVEHLAVFDCNDPFLGSFAKDPDVAVGEVDVGSLQVGKLGNAQAGCEQHFDHGGFTEGAGAVGMAVELGMRGGEYASDLAEREIARKQLGLFYFQADIFKGILGKVPFIEHPGDERPQGRALAFDGTGPEFPVQDGEIRLERVAVELHPIFGEEFRKLPQVDMVCLDGLGAEPPLRPARGQILPHDLHS